jgi:homoserine dehydrogenase
MPTGSAVVADIMEIGRRILMEPANALPTGAGQPQLRVQPMDSIATLYYLRFMVLDKPGVLSELSGILGRHNISIASVIQRGRQIGGAVPLVIMTHTARESDVQRAMVEIRKLESVTEDPVLIRVEGEES